MDEEDTNKEQAQEREKKMKVKTKLAHDKQKIRISDHPNSTDEESHEASNSDNSARRKKKKKKWAQLNAMKTLLIDSFVRKNIVKLNRFVAILHVKVFLFTITQEIQKERAAHKK